MALKQIEVTVEAEGGDRGKRFVITRMDAIAADRWGRHVTQALIRAGADLPDSAISSGVAGVAAMGIRLFGNVAPDEADRLLDQLLGCVKMISEAGMPVPLLPSQIEEIETISFLHQEAFKLHTSFFKGAARLFSPLVAVLMSGVLEQPQSPPTSPESLQPS